MWLQRMGGLRKRAGGGSTLFVGGRLLRPVLWPPRRERRDARPGLGVSLSLVDQATATKTETTDRLQGYSRQ